MIHQTKPAIRLSLAILLLAPVSQSQAALTDFEKQISGNIVNTINTANMFEIQNEFESVFNDTPTDFLGADEAFTFGISDNDS